MLPAVMRQCSTRIIQPETGKCSQVSDQRHRDHLARPPALLDLGPVWLQVCGTEHQWIQLLRLRVHALTERQVPHIQAAHPVAEDWAREPRPLRSLLAGEQSLDWEMFQVLRQRLRQRGLKPQQELPRNLELLTAASHLWEERKVHHLMHYHFTC